MPGITCDVCGGAAVGVCSSALGACSFAYCKQCLELRAEPYQCTVIMCAMNGNEFKHFAPWFHPVIEGTCKRAGKTLDQFWQEVKDCAKKEGWS